jgi:hypothetical protein
MRRQVILYGSTTAIGVLLLWPLLESFHRGGINGTHVLPVSFMALVGIVLFAAGLCGVGNQFLGHFQEPVGALGKRFRVLELTAVLGGAFLVAFLIMGFLVSYSEAAYKFFMSIYNIYVNVIFSFFFGGICLLTIGVCGVARRHFGNYRNLLTILLAILFPSLILMPFVYYWISSLSVGY